MEKLDKIASDLDALSIQDLADLVPMLEERWGVSAKPQMAVGVIPGVPDSAPAAKTEFDVELTSFGDKKINVIKVMRSITGLPLKEAKELVEKAPVLIKEGVSEGEGEEIKAHFEKEGAVVTLK